MSEADKKEEARLDAIIQKENRNAGCLLCDYVGTCPPAVCQHLKKVHDQKMKKSTNWDYTTAAPTSATKVVKKKAPLEPQTYANSLFANEKYSKMTTDEFIEMLDHMYSRPTAIDREYAHQLSDGYDAEFEDYIGPNVNIFNQPHVCGAGCHHAGDTNHHEKTTVPSDN